MKLSSNLKKAALSAAAGAGTVAALVLIARRATGVRRGYVSRWKLAGNARDRVVWRFDNRVRVLPPGKELRTELSSPAAVRWTTDQWNTAHDTRTTLRNGMHVADLRTRDLPPGSRVQFTFFWPEANRWEGQDFEVTVPERARYGGAVSY